MTPEEKQAMLAFLGTMHAQAKQTDQMIVGQSNFVKPISRSIQDQFTEVLTSPVYSSQPTAQPYPEPIPQHTSSEVYREVAPQHTPTEDQLMFRFDEPAEPTQQIPTIANNSELIEILKDINLNLHTIVDILKEQNKPNARNKNSKKE